MPPKREKSGGPSTNPSPPASVFESDSPEENDGSQLAPASKNLSGSASLQPVDKSDRSGGIFFSQNGKMERKKRGGPSTNPSPPASAFESDSPEENDGSQLAPASKNLSGSASLQPVDKSDRSGGIFFSLNGKMERKKRGGPSTNPSPPASAFESDSPEENDGSQLAPASKNLSGSASLQPVDKSDRSGGRDVSQNGKMADGKSHKSFVFISLAVIVLLISVLIGAGHNYFSMIGTLKGLGKLDYNYTKIYEEGLQNLQASFTGQTPRFWKLLKIRGLAHLRDSSPRQPLVFLLAAAPNAHDVVDCFATKLGKLLDPENAENLSKIIGQDHRNNQGDTTKKTLDNILCDKFEKGKKVALVQQLNLLPPPSPMIFHSYCDDQNAQYKHAALIFTVHLPRNLDPTLTAVEAEGTVEKYLSEEVWIDSPYNQDKIAALLSRIADTVLLVSPERGSTLEGLCTV